MPQKRYRNANNHTSKQPCRVFSFLPLSLQKLGSAIQWIPLLLSLTLDINDQWLLLKPELLWLLIVNALQLNELSALRNTFYPEYKYLYIYIYIYDFHIFTTSVFCPLDSGVIQILDKRGSGKLCQFWAQAVSIETFLTLRTHDHRKYPKTVTGHVIWI